MARAGRGAGAGAAAMGAARDAEQQPGPPGEEGLGGAEEQLVSTVRRGAGTGTGAGAGRAAGGPRLTRVSRRAPGTS